MSVLRVFLSPVITVILKPILAIRLEKGSLASYISKGEYSLDSHFKRYNIEALVRHTAPGYLFLTAKLLIQLINIVDEKGTNTVGKLLEKRKNGTAKSWSDDYFFRPFGIKGVLITCEKHS